MIIVDICTSIANNIVLLIKNLGYLGIFLGMAIESSIFPLPSEVVLIPAGALVAKGQMSFFLVLIASILGSILGATFNYFLALFLGRKTVEIFIDKYGKFLFLTKKSLKKTDTYFSKHGEITTFTGRLIPLIRHLISLPAGFARMNFSRFIFFTGLGAGLWSIALISVGYFYGSSTVQPAVKITATVIFLISTAIILSYIIYKSSKMAKKKKIDLSV